MEVPTDLLDAYADGALTSDQFEQLAAWIRTSPAHAQEFTRRAALDAHLRVYLQANDDPLDGVERTDAAMKPAASSSLLAPIFRRPTPLSWAVAAMVIGLLMTAMAYIAVPLYRELAQTPSDATRQQSVGRITGMNNVSWGNSDTSPRMNSVLFGDQHLELQTGLVEITLHNGAQVVVQAPARLRMQSANALRLNLGRLAATVPKAAKGFAVQTSAASFVDLGTEFSVAVDDAQNATMFVTQGQVAYHARGAPQQFIVQANQGVMIDHRGVVQNIAALPAALARVGRGVQVENLIVDGSFEQFAPADLIPRTRVSEAAAWRSVGTSDVVVDTGRVNPDGWSPQPNFAGRKIVIPLARRPRGDNFLRFSGDPEPGGAIEQQISTIPGHRYMLSFRLARNTANNTPTMKVTVLHTATDRPSGDAEAGDKLALANQDVLIHWAPYEFRTATVHFVADSERTIVCFRESLSSQSRSVGPLLDDVRVVPLPTNSPAKPPP